MEKDDPNNTVATGLAAQAIHADRVIPKFCSHVEFGVLNNRNVIMTLLYAEGNNGVIIERVAIDVEHLKNLRETIDVVLTEAIKKEAI